MFRQLYKIIKLNEIFCTKKIVNSFVQIMKYLTKNYKFIGQKNQKKKKLNKK